MSSFHYFVKNCRSAAGGHAALLRGLLCFALLTFALPASAQTVNMFPEDVKDAWTRIAIPPTHTVSQIAQWHIYPSQHEIVCDGNGGHEWLRFNRELGNFTFHVKWRFTPVAGNAKYNSGVFFRNSKDGTIWHQAQTSLSGGYIFGETPIGGKMTRFNLSKEMRANRINPAGDWNTYDIRCLSNACTLTVNGEMVNTLYLSVKTGYVGLEAEGYRIEFKDFKLQELP
ncbi:MAG: DUF1080 domain-containing protein [Acidobacteriota bacterium]|nr:DUF1080 domain-containing protein [Acidobacteriota bacterium]